MNKKNWRLKEPVSEEICRQLGDFSRLSCQLLYNRGLIDPAAIDSFFNASYEKDKHDAFLLLGLEEALEIIIQSIKNQELIVIYGDYDADGVTSSAVLYETLRAFKAKVEVYIPDRVSEGYGLNREALVEIRAMGGELLITVDNGIRSRDEVAYAKELGLKVVITDHHIPAEDKSDWPDAVIVNPWTCPKNYPFSPLAGVGVAAKLAGALINKAKIEPELKLRLEERIFDLVALGTIADCVPLVGENRLLVKRGLEIINKRKRLGLRELMAVAKLEQSKSIDAWNVGFQLTPRLNAAGRIKHANTAFELLVSNDELRARELADELNSKNTTRQQITEQVFKQAVDDYEKSDKKKLIAVVNPKNEIWNEGVIGLAAGRLVERYYRPALVISGENGQYKGSGRSIKQLDLIKAVSGASEYLLKFGGHKAACGFSIEGEDNLHSFIAKISALVEKELDGLDLKAELEVEYSMSLAEADEQAFGQVEAFGPFGEANPKPVLYSKNLLIVDMQRLGGDGQHLKMRLQQADSPLRSAIGFSVPIEWGELRIGDRVDLVYYLDINDWNGRRETQLKIVDLKKV